MNKNNQQRIKKSGLILSILIITTVISGCTSNDTNTPSGLVQYPILSATDGIILDNAHAEYTMLRQQYTTTEARQHLLNKLNNETDGVEDAKLGLDGYTIFITYTDGDLALIDTFELNEDTPQGPQFSLPTYTTVSPPQNNQPPYILHFDEYYSESTCSLPTTYTREMDYNIIVVGPHKKTTCESKKVYVLAPCYWEFDPAPTDACINLFKTHGWNTEDITLKLVEKNPWDDDFDTAVLTPDDYFNLDDYGIMLFTGHGTVKVRDNFNEDNLFLQFCYADNATFVNDKRFQTWKDQQKLIIGQRHIAGEGATQRWVYTTALRADVLRQELKTLPSSFYYFSTCYGGFFNKLFLDKGGKIFYGWDNSVDGDIADANMLSIVRNMLENESAAYTAYADHTVVKSYDMNNWSNMTRPVVLLPPSSPHTPRPPTPSPIIRFDIFPDFHINDISYSYYFPTWVDLEITGIPDGTDSLQINMYDANGTLLIQGENNVDDDVTEVDITHMANACFPPTETYKLEIIAFNNRNEQLAITETITSLSIGKNLFQKQIQQTGELTIEFKDSSGKGFLDAKRITQSLSIDAKLMNRPSGNILYIWDSYGDSSLGGFNYFKQQHVESTNDDNVYFVSNGTGVDGTKIPISCMAYLLKDDGSRELLGSASADIEVYNPSQTYSLCGTPDGTEGLHLGSGSSWSFYIVDHGPLYGNEFFARTGDQIRAYCNYPGYMAEGYTYDIYIRKGAIDETPSKTQLIVSQSEIQENMNKIVIITL